MNGAKTSSFIAMVLAGGKSKRMGEDKGFIKYNGLAQKYFAYKQLEKSNLFDEVFLSVADISEEKFDYNCIVDLIPGIGPLSAVYSALKRSECEAVFAIATDMPEAKIEDIKNLVGEFEPFYDAVCFTNKKGYLEPLFSIYNKSILNEIEKAIEEGNYSLNKILKKSNIKLVQIKNEISLLNINTQEEKEEYMKKNGKEL